MASDEREIRTMHSIWIDAVNAGDLARLLTLVAEDVVFLTPGQAPFGREGFSSNFRTAHQQMRICCTSELEEVIVVGEVAYTRSRDALSVTPRAGGKAAQFAGHRMTVYRKQRERNALAPLSQSGDAETSGRVLEDWAAKSREQ